MRQLCCTVAVLTLLQINAVVGAQQSGADVLVELRTQVLERVQRRGAPRESLSRIFALPDDMLVVKAAEIVFRDQHRLAVLFSVNSTDVFLTESRTTPAGAVLLTVFHSDLTRALRSAAAGADLDSLQISSDASSRFQDVLATWDRHLPGMIERMRQNAARQ